MTDPLHRIRRFLSELRLRDVYKVGITYLVAAFVVLQLADLAGGAFGFPGWFEPMIWVVAGLGFPLALVLAWAFERTPEGVRRTLVSGDPVESTRDLAEGEVRPTEARGSRGRRAVDALVGLGLVGAAVAGGWYLVGGGGESPEVGDRSIAVLPFEPLGQAEPDAFTEGMHDDLLARLSNVSDLKVISRTAVQQYRGSEMTTGEIARELGVRWVLEGGVQEMGDEIQVNAQLIDPRTETYAWADSYRRDLTAASLFDLQSEITKRIATSLEAELSPGEQERVERRPTGDLDAYRLYVQGRSHLDTRTAEGMRQAVDYFQRAIERDSSYALAWSGLADAVGLFQSTAYASPERSLPDHERTARRALELDPSLAEAHASLGMVRWNQRNVPAALERLERAVELQPSYAQAHVWLAELYGAMDRPEEALRYAQRAVELDPYSPLYQLVLGWTHWWVGGATGSAMDYVRRAVEIEPGLATAHADEGLLLSDAGRHDEAIAAFRRALERASEGSFGWGLALGGLGTAYVRADRSVRAREVLSRLDQGEDAEFWKAMIHAALGDDAETFRALRNVEWGIVLGWNIRVISAFDSIRDDPRYGELVRGINQGWGLNPDGSLPDRVDLSYGSESGE